MSKEKQIEDIANVLYESDNKRNIVICGIEALAEDIYNAGYRKQSEGEWEEQLEEYGESYFFDGFKCSRCEEEFSVPYEKERDDFLQTMKFCPNCGAKMKGGAE